MILNGDQIRERLERQQIFRDGSYDVRNLAGAKYDLRMGTDFLVIPTKTGAVGVRVARGEAIQDYVVLSRGQWAFVSTAERLCMPWDLVGNIGVKASLACKGVFVLGGFFVDPGYGQSADDERLHFLLANMSHDDVVLNPGEEKIASIQFSTVEEPSERHAILSPTDVLTREFFREPYRKGLMLVEDLEQGLGEIEDFKRELEIVERATRDVVVFGAYLFMVTILAAAIAVILTMISGEDSATAAENSVDVIPSEVGGGLLLGIAFVLGVIVALGLAGMVRTVRRTSLGRNAKRAR